MSGIIESMLKRHEGLRLESYKCSMGVWTIGYGHTGPDVYPDQKITKERAEQLLKSDILIAESDAKKFPYYSRLSEIRKAVIVNMVFNLGLNRFSKFMRFNKAMIDKDYLLASEEMKKSLWYDQVGERARELSAMMALDKTVTNKDGIWK